MSSRVWESTVVDAPVEKVWDLVKDLNFAYLPNVARVVTAKDQNPAEVGGLREVHYKDGSQQTIKLMELSEVSRTVAWDLITTSGAHYVSGASYTMKLRRITQGNATFVEWTVDFSNDATAAVIMDATFKAREHFRALAAAARARLLAEAQTNQVTVAGQRMSIPALTRQLSSRSQHLQKLFQSLDTNKNGVLEADEFAFAINKLYGANLPDEAIRTMLNMADLNGDHVISYDEFVKFLESQALDQRAASLDEKAALGVKLYYFNARGRGELARYIMAEGDIPWEDIRFTKEEWGAKYKAQAPLGQAPWIELATGAKLAETSAIVRWLARVAGLNGKDSFEAARVDMMYEAFADLFAPVLKAFFMPEGDEKKAATEKVFKEHVPTWNAYLEKQLDANSGAGGDAKAAQHPYFVGNALTLADLQAYNIYSTLLPVRPTVLDGFPKLRALVDRVGARPAIQAWIKRRPVTPM